MKKIVAVIGSSGAIGSAFCKSLLEDHSIEKIYKFARNNIDKDSDNEINISIDIEDEDSIKKAIEKWALSSKRSIGYNNAKRERILT